MLRKRKEIMQAFVPYYSFLYSPILPYAESTLIDLLASLQILVDALFTAEELAATIGSFPNGKSLGPNGIPAEWYKHYLELLTP